MKIGPYITYNFWDMVNALFHTGIGIGIGFLIWG